MTAPPEAGRIWRHAGTLLASTLAVALVLAWARAAYAHGPGSLAGVLAGWGLVTVSTGAGWVLYRVALAGGQPFLWGLLVQAMRAGGVLLIIIMVHELGPPWAEPFVETALLGYLLGMVAEVVLLHHSARP